MLVFCDSFFLLLLKHAIQTEGKQYLMLGLKIESLYVFNWGYNLCILRGFISRFKRFYLFCLGPVMQEKCQCPHNYQVFPRQNKPDV